MNPSFILHLRSSMQSYADQDFGLIRKAGLFPSRSAVLGIVAAASGVPRFDPRLVEIHQAFKVHAAVVRAGAIRTDYHVVDTGAANRTQTWRDYHHDAWFVALLEARIPEKAPAVEDARRALMRPYYASWLGRKCCVPSRPLLPENAQGATHIEALARAAKVSAKSVTIYLDGWISIEDIASAGAKFEGRGTRRDLLVYPPRVYATRDYTAVSVKVDQNSDYFDALR